MKPIAELKMGEAHLLEKPRTRGRAVERMLAIVKERVSTQPVHVNVMHTDALEDAKALQRRVDSEFNCVENYVSEFTPVMGAHLGPGLLGIAFYTEP
jgi:fatty acid-binding protein DegV